MSLTPRVATGLLALSLVFGCHEPTGGGDTDGTTDGTTDGYETPEVTDALRVCGELPEAAAAGWVPGEEVMLTGASTPERLTAAGARTWRVAVDLLRVTDASRSVAASPTSMSLALGMAKTEYEGGQCGDEIQARMHFAEDGAALHETLGASIPELEGRSLPEAGDEEPVVVLLQPSIWDLRGSRSPLPAYGSTVHSVSGDLEAIRTVMNCVIEQQSQGLLTDFIPPGLPASDTTSFDVNVAFLQAPWAQGLRERGPLAFTRDDGTEVSLPAMSEEVVAGLYQDDLRWAIDLPLRGHELSVLLVVPAPGMPTDMGTFADELTDEQLLTMLSGTSSTDIALDMPKVDIPSETIDYYDPLGFDCEPFTVRTVLHSASVQMDENGVKATAATVVEHWDTGGEPEFVDVRLDRPFLFFVYDRSTRFVLFSGRFAG